MTRPITIIDTGGNAGFDSGTGEMEVPGVDVVSGAKLVEVVPANGELISGLSQIELQSPFGVLRLNPNLKQGGWYQQ